MIFRTFACVFACEACLRDTYLTGAYICPRQVLTCGQCRVAWIRKTLINICAVGTLVSWFTFTLVRVELIDAARIHRAWVDRTLVRLCTCSSISSVSGIAGACVCADGVGARGIGAAPIGNQAFIHICAYLAATCVTKLSVVIGGWWGHLAGYLLISLPTSLEAYNEEGVNVYIDTRYINRATRNAVIK